MTDIKWMHERDLLQERALRQMREKAPRIHCITNPVTMQDTANVLLAAGGSAIMAQAADEAEEITEGCDALLLNTGVPDAGKFKVCHLAGHKANALGHPLVLDPVGAGASRFRREETGKLLKGVRCSIIRCNQTEAEALLSLSEEGESRKSPTKCVQRLNTAFSGVESCLDYPEDALKLLAQNLAERFSCVAFISGRKDAVSDGIYTELIEGGDPRMKRVTGGGCMLSALCALFCAAGLSSFEAALCAGRLWKQAAEAAGRRVGKKGGIGSFHRELFNALDLLCRGETAGEADALAGAGIAGERNCPKEKKRIHPEQLSLYAVTDRRWLNPGESLADTVEVLIRNGVSCVQLREKQISDEKLIEEAQALRNICNCYSVPFIVNDRPDIARLVGADGVHVGTSDMKVAEVRRFLGGDYIIGASAHTVEEALLAETAGADYLGCGAVFGTDSKADASGLPDGMLEKICGAVQIPVVAIGGIDAENIDSLAGKGAAGAAVISALFASGDKAAAARRLRSAVAGWKERKGTE